ncbi:MAG: hypothetical protein LBG71_01835 [Clostridiales Family XIII bacterium]|jgi:hypothetical protein|nr:hypothetical protein [Clostridiales Family XIII bacterium]
MKKKYILAIILLAIIGVSALYLWQRDKFVEGHTPFSREEIMQIFNDNETKFDYIVTVLKGSNLKGVDIRIKRTTKEIYIDEAKADTIRPYSEVMPSDDQFEAFLIDLLVQENLGKICIDFDGNIDFGPNFPITYSENDRRVDDNPEPIWGKLKENWYYYIHIPI